MKVTAATAALALLPVVAIADSVEKRAASCNTVFGQGAAAKVAGNVRLATQTKTVGGKTVRRTLKTKHTVLVTPTVTRTLSGTTTVTDRVTATSTGKPTTITITGSSTSTVPAQPGFTAAANALPRSNTNALKKAAAAAAAKHSVAASGHARLSHSDQHSKRDAEAEAEAEAEPDAAPKKPVAGARVALSVVCTRTARGTVTVTAKVAQKPYATKYAKPVTKLVNRQKTKHVRKVVATTTVRRRQVVELPRATHWAGCNADNLLGWTWGKGGAGSGSNSTVSGGSHGGNGTAGGQVGISSVILVSGTTAKSFDTSTATQCCIRCQTTPGCVGSQWRSGVCNMHIRPARFGACSRNQAVFTLGSFFANPNNLLDPQEGYILSNGRCGGTWKFGGLSS